MAKRSYSRDIGGVFSAYLISLIASLGMYVLLTRTLGPEDFGIYSTLIVIPMVATSIVQLGIRRSSIFHLGQQKFSRNTIVSTVFTLLLFSSLAGMVLSYVAFRVYNNPLFDHSLIYLIILTIPFKLALNLTGGIFLGTDEIRSANIQNWTPLALNLLLLVVFVWIIPMGVTGAVLALLISNVVMALYYAISLWRRYKVRLKIHAEVIRAMVKMGVVFAISFMVIQLNLRVDMLILNRIGDAAETGYYGLAAQICEQLWLLPTAVGVIIMSRTSSSDSLEQTTQETAKLMRVTLFVGVILAALLVILVPLFLPLIFGEDFRQSSMLLIWLIPGILSFMLFRVLNGQLSGMGKPGISAIIFSIALVVNVVLNFLWIPKYGALGAAWATDVSYIAGSVTLTVIFSRICNISIIDLVLIKHSDFKELRMRINGLSKK